MSRAIIKTLELTEPIHDAGRTIEKLEFTTPRASHLRVIDTTPGDVGRAVKLIASLCDVAEEAIDELLASDFEAASEIAAGFFGEGGSA